MKLTYEDCDFGVDGIGGVLEGGVWVPLDPLDPGPPKP